MSPGHPFKNLKKKNPQYPFINHLKNYLFSSQSVLNLSFFSSEKCFLHKTIDIKPQVYIREKLLFILYQRTINFHVCENSQWPFLFKTRRRYNISTFLLKSSSIFLQHNLSPSHSLSLLLFPCQSSIISPSISLPPRFANLIPKDKFMIAKQLGEWGKMSVRKRAREVLIDEDKERQKE